MLATSFSPDYGGSGAVLIHAAGVSNSSCVDPREFEREGALLQDSLSEHQDAEVFVYFSTCSVLDPDLRGAPYVLHKKEMERLVRSHPHHLILRLPQLAGRSKNPHTILNFLYGKISRSERFTVWRNATRNVIDVEDVVKIARRLIGETGIRRDTLSIANTRNHGVDDIVSVFEAICGKTSIYDVIDKGRPYAIDVQRIMPLLRAAEVDFGPDYLYDVLRKYYGQPG